MHEFGIKWTQCFLTHELCYWMRVTQLERCIYKALQGRRLSRTRLKWLSVRAHLCAHGLTPLPATQLVACVNTPHPKSKGPQGEWRQIALSPWDTVGTSSSFLRRHLFYPHLQSTPDLNLRSQDQTVGKMELWCCYSLVDTHSFLSVSLYFYDHAHITFLVASSWAGLFYNLLLRGNFRCHLTSLNFSTVGKPRVVNSLCLVNPLDPRYWCWLCTGGSPCSLPGT